MSQWKYTTDIPDDFEAELVAMAGRLQARPIDLAACWMSESELHSDAHNPGGATGIFQIIPKNLVGLHFPGTWHEFQRLSATSQLAWAERYYAPHRGRLVNAAACYVATFLPALLAHAMEPSFVLCARSGPYPDAYSGNHRAFDPAGKGYITVQDLVDRMVRVQNGARWQEIADRIRMAEQAVDTSPDVTPTLPGNMPNVASLLGFQCALNRLGYECLQDGIWGSQSEIQCMAFQTDHNCEVDGIPGPQTQSAMIVALKAGT